LAVDLIIPPLTNVFSAIDPTESTLANALIVLKLANVRANIDSFGANTI
jgi:hypothetical protein